MSSFTLKIIAIITMFIDHTGYFLYPDKYSFRIVGRLAFPIFAFMVGNSFRYTHDKLNYLKNLGFFAVLYQIPSLYFLYQPNIFFTLFLGLASIYLYENKDNRIIFYLLFPLFLLAGDSLNLDYGSYGILMIFLFHLSYDNKILCSISFIALNLFYFYIGSYFKSIGIHTIQVFSIFSLVFILIYNKKRGPKLKYFFYLFYPLHIVFLVILKKFYF